MPYMSYFVFLGLLLLCSIFSGWASMRVHSSYNAFSAQKNASHMTGYDTAVRLLRANGVYDISVGKVKGNLTDHFDPKRQIVNLSDSTYGNDSVAAVAVAAHEIGHVMQKEKGYVPYKIRSALVPVVNIGARMAVPLVLVGLLLDLLLNFSSVGFYAAIAGIILYGLSSRNSARGAGRFPPREKNAARGGSPHRGGKTGREQGVIRRRADLRGGTAHFHALLPPFRALGAGALRKSEKKLGMIRLNAKQRVGIRSRTRRGKADRGRV